MNEKKMDELLRLMRAVVPDTSDMSDAGRVGFVYKFDYDPAVQYEELDVVKFGMSLWTPKEETIGNSPPDQSQEGQENVEENDFWVLFLPGALGSDYVKKTDLAKSPTETEPGKPGIIYPDGKTITVDGTGMIKGAPPGKVLSQEEAEQQIASGELVDGDVVYLTGPAAGENGLLVKVDSELKDSVNPVQNRVIKDALDRLEALIEETNALRATLETFGLSKVTESSAVTDVNSGLVLSAKEKNSSEQGTIMNFVSKLEESLGNIKFLSYARFNNSTETEFVLNVCQNIKEKESRHIYLFNGVWETHSEFLCIAARQEQETLGIIFMHNKPVIFSSYGSGEPVISKILIEQY